MNTIRVGGVPEHFNYPWHYGIQNSIFKNNKLAIDWQDIKGGSGAMCSMLENDELDIALVLTEGIVKHIHEGGTARIIQQFVKSPLIWGVHCSKSFVKSKQDFSSARFARSRVGSGSHIMAYVHAEQRDYPITDNHFVTVKNIDGALEAFQKDTADILLWEKFMTQPYVDQGLVSRIDECVSPWPCFALVASGDFLKNHSELLRSLSDSIIQSSVIVMKKKETIKKISEMFQLEISQVEQWYSSVEWQTSDWISTKMLNNVVSTLHRVGLLESKLEASQLCYSGAKLY